jgi:SAM-dependent methyltransferase
LILARIHEHFPHLRQVRGGAGPRVLEFGAGQGHQAPLLQAVGSYVASDVYISPHMDPRLNFVVCDIARTPFAANSFDLVYSNHVLEHVAALDRALQEIQRIGTPECVYAFSVPTPLWLFLWLPARYADKLRSAFHKVASRIVPTDPGDNEAAEDDVRTGAETQVRGGQLAARPRRFWAALCPGGHGEYPRFWQAVGAFAGQRWRARFEHHGLRVVAHYPLLLYATARWPFIPVNRLGPALGLASSQLFLLQRAFRSAA